MTDPDVARRNAYQAVKARSFKRVCDRPTWETKEHFLEEARETAMIFDQVTYDWCGEYGLLAEIEGTTRYKTVTGLNTEAYYRAVCRVQSFLPVNIKRSSSS